MLKHILLNINIQCNQSCIKIHVFSCIKISANSCIMITLQWGEEEIKGAYRRQSRLFHPDRHCDANKESAEHNFQKIKRAYEGTIWHSLGVRIDEINRLEVVDLSGSLPTSNDITCYSSNNITCYSSNNITYYSTNNITCYSTDRPPNEDDIRPLRCAGGREWTALSSLRHGQKQGDIDVLY